MSNTLMEFTDSLFATPGLDRFSQGRADAQDAKIYDYCDECGGEIYSKNDGVPLGGMVFCKNCVENVLIAVGD